MSVTTCTLWVWARERRETVGARDGERGVHPHAGGGPRNSSQSIDNSWFAVSGEGTALSWARQLAELWGGRTLSVKPGRQALYHAAAVIAGNHLVTLLDSAETLMVASGVPAADARTALAALAKRIGFRVAPGFSERVIFRELFPKGLTLLDLRDVGITRLSLSHIAARQELRNLTGALNLPGVVADF